MKYISGMVLFIAQAIQAWPQLAKTGLILGSPATVHPDNQWMQSFMKQAKAKTLRVDFVAVHNYGGPDADRFVSQLKKYIKCIKRRNKPDLLKLSLTTSYMGVIFTIMTTFFMHSCH